MTQSEKQRAVRFESSDFYGHWNEFTATHQMWLTRVNSNGATLSRLWWTLLSVFYDWWSAVNPQCVYLLRSVCVSVGVRVCGDVYYVPVSVCVLNCVCFFECWGMILCIDACVCFSWMSIIVRTTFKTFRARTFQQHVLKGLLINFLLWLMKSYLK